MVPSVSLTTLGVSTGGLLAQSFSPGLTEVLGLVSVLSAFVFICSVEALLAS